LKRKRIEEFTSDSELAEENIDDYMDELKRKRIEEFTSDSELAEEEPPPKRPKLVLAYDYKTDFNLSRGLWRPEVEHDKTLKPNLSEMRFEAGLEVLRYRAITLLRKRFSTLCNGALKEQNKTIPNDVFETWILRNINDDFPSEDPIIPDQSTYIKVASRLLVEGIRLSRAKGISERLTAWVGSVQKGLSKSRLSLKRRKAPRFSKKDDVVSLAYGKVRVKLHEAHYEKLQILYKMHNEEVNQRVMTEAIYCCALRYTSLGGGGFQAALQEDCFDVLKEDWGVTFEGFASPFNCMYKRFCSAFPDTDAPFGSVGSFFDFHPTEGSFELNPPFEETLVERIADHLEMLFSNATGALQFVLIISMMNKTKGYKLLKNLKQTKKVVFLRQDKHGFCEGLQHKRETRYKISSCHSSLFFIQNSEAESKFPVKKEKVTRLLESFSSKQMQELEAIAAKRREARGDVAVNA